MNPNRAGWGGRGASHRAPDVGSAGRRRPLPHGVCLICRLREPS